MKGLTCSPAPYDSFVLLCHIQNHLSPRVRKPQDVGLAEEAMGAQDNNVDNIRHS